jgi:hypothetical protein
MVASVEQAREIHGVEPHSVTIAQLEMEYLAAVRGVFAKKYEDLAKRNILPTVSMQIQSGTGESEIADIPLVVVTARLQPGEKFVISRDGGFYALLPLPMHPSVYDGIHFRTLPPAEVMTHAGTAMAAVERLEKLPPR